MIKAKDVKELSKLLETHKEVCVAIRSLTKKNPDDLCTVYYAVGEEEPTFTISRKVALLAARAERDKIIQRFKVLGVALD